MENPSTIHDTFVLEKHYPHDPQRVFAAFSDRAQKRRWYADGEAHQIEKYEMDFRTGGIEIVQSRLSETSAFPGAELRYQGTFLNIVPFRRIVIASTMTFAGNPISASLATFEFLPNGAGTDLIFTHQGAYFENSDGPELRQDGWKKILDRLGAALG